MYNLHNPKPVRWSHNIERATQKLWSIDAGGCTCGRAIAICNAITANVQLPFALRRQAEQRRTSLIVGRQSIKRVALPTVIQLRAAQ